MEIYSFDSPINHLMNIICMVGAIALGLILFFIIYFWALQFIAYKKDKEKFPVKLTVFFSLIIIVPLVGCLGLGNLFIKSVVYENNMRGADVMVLTGDVTIISCEEYYYRGNFMGYEMVFNIEGETISPSNTFPAKVVEHFESNEVLIIQYGIIEGDGLYVWNIKTSTD